MAIYHTDIKTFSRARGHTATAASAYRAGMLLVDPRTGVRHDYRRRRDVVAVGCVAPSDAPDWAFDPRALWAAAEAAERRKDATVAREFEISLPHELTDAQRCDLASSLTHALVGQFGFAAQWAIHAPRGDGVNHHVHILATTRQMAPCGLVRKTRELDGGKAGREAVGEVRAMVSSVVNAALEAAGAEARIDHRTLKAQARDALDRGDIIAAALLDRPPMKHLNKADAALERRGVRTAVGQYNDAVREAAAEAFNAAMAKAAEAGQAVPGSDGHSQASAAEDVRRESSRNTEAPGAIPAAAACLVGPLTPAPSVPRTQTPVAAPLPRGSDTAPPDPEAARPTLCTGLAGPDAAANDPFGAIWAAADRDGQALPGAEGHGHAAALKDREREMAAMATSVGAALAGADAEIPMAPEEAEDRALTNAFLMPIDTPEQQRRAGEVAFGHAAVYWKRVPFANHIRIDWTNAFRVMSAWVERVSAYAAKEGFHIDARELLRRMHALVAAMGRAVDRRDACGAANHRLHEAEEALARFRDDRPHQGTGSGSEWAARTKQKVSEVRQRRTEAEDAWRRHSDPKAVLRDRAVIQECAVSLDAFCGTLLDAYPVDADREHVAEAGPSSAAPPLPSPDSGATVLRLKRPKP